MRARLRAAVFAVVVSAGLIVAGSVAVAHSGKSPRPAQLTASPTRLEGRLVCTQGAECVYTIHNPGTETSYISYWNTAFTWGDAHFSGGGCLAADQWYRQVAYTHDGHGNEILPHTSVSLLFSLPYKPHDIRCSDPPS